MRKKFAKLFLGAAIAAAGIAAISSSVSVYAMPSHFMMVKDSGGGSGSTVTYPTKTTVKESFYLLDTGYFKDITVREVVGTEFRDVTSEYKDLKLSDIFDSNSFFKVTKTTTYNQTTGAVSNVSNMFEIQMKAKTLSNGYSIKVNEYLGRRVYLSVDFTNAYKQFHCGIESDSWNVMYNNKNISYAKTDIGSSYKLNKFYTFGFTFKFVTVDPNDCPIEESSTHVLTMTIGKNEIINKQGDYEDIKFDNGNIARQGCGVVATHNALLLKGINSDFIEVRDWFVNGSNTAIPFTEVWGCSPEGISSYLDSKGVNYELFGAQERLAFGAEYIRPEYTAEHIRPEYILDYLIPAGAPMSYLDIYYDIHPLSALQNSRSILTQVMEKVEARLKNENEKEVIMIFLVRNNRDQLSDGAHYYAVKAERSTYDDELSQTLCPYSFTAINHSLSNVTITSIYSFMGDGSSIKDYVISAWVLD